MSVRGTMAPLTAPLVVRRAARGEQLTGQTAGLAHGFVQANLVALPVEFAADFLEFCRRNPKPCPLIGVSEPGETRMTSLGTDLDLRTDLPRYRVWKDGSLVATPLNVTGYWRDDLIAFLLGCSFSFEEALMDEGIVLKHVMAATTVPMYRTSVACEPAGRFAGPLVVSMRPMTEADALRATEITSRFPWAHGAPVHVGDGSAIGIKDLSKPDYGERVDVANNEIPVFWACGVTPQAALEDANISFAITHAPGCMLVTDIPNTSLFANHGEALNGRTVMRHIT